MSIESLRINGKEQDPEVNPVMRLGSLKARRGGPDIFPIPIRATYAFRKLHDSMVTYRPAGDPSSWVEDDVATVEKNLLCLGDEGDSPKKLAQFRKTWEVELACRANVKCMNRRVATANAKLFKKKAEEVGEDICDLRATIAEIKRQIAEEHRYARRTGVLSLGDLQELKEDLRNSEETLAERMSDYRMLLGKSARISCNRVRERTQEDEPSPPSPPPRSPSKPVW